MNKRSTLVLTLIITEAKKQSPTTGARANDTPHT